MELPEKGYLNSFFIDKHCVKSHNLPSRNIFWKVTNAARGNWRPIGSWENRRNCKNNTPGKAILYWLCYLANIG